MGTNTTVILGGYGGAGSAISKLLLDKTELCLKVAGRREEMAKAFSERLNEGFSGERASYIHADASDPKSLKEAFSGADMVIAASTTTPYVRNVAQAALDAGADYLDIYYPQEIVSVLKDMAPAIEKSGLFFVTQAGFNPGLPSVFVRKAAPYFSSYEKAKVAVAMNSWFETRESVYEIVDSFGDYSAEVFKKGKWRKAGYRDTPRFDFGPPFGTKTCYPMTLEEMKALPDLFDLDALGFYAAGLNWFVDYLVAPATFLLWKVKREFGRDVLADLAVWGSKRFSPREEAVAVLLEAEGLKEGTERKVRIEASHHDVYLFTAISVTSFMLQYLKGDIVRPGLWVMGHIVDPARFFEDMELMGAKIDVEVSGV